MKRKAIQLAKQTIVVSLPAKWVKQQGIKKGDEIDVEERGKELVIGTKKESLSKTEINISNLGESIIWRYLQSIYRSGCDEVKIISDKSIDIKLLNNIIDNLIGFEIIEQKNNFCLIKDISNIKGEEFENVLKRIFLILISTSEEFLDFMKKTELKKINFVVDIDRQVNKFSDFCCRLLHKRHDFDIKKRIMLYHLIRQLEYIGDNLKAIARIIINSKQKKLSREILELFEEFCKIFNYFFEFFYKFNLDQTRKIYEKRNNAQKIYEIALKKLNVNEREIAIRIRLNISSTLDIIDNVFSISI